MDPDTGEIIVEEVTDSNCHDSTMLPPLLDECSGRVQRVFADGAYDTASCYKALHARGITAHIPPRIGAVTHEDEHWQARNRAIRDIVALGGDSVAMGIWKKLMRYGRRSMVEAAFSRLRCLQDDFKATTAFMEFPVGHYKAIRTTNVIERAFEEYRRRSKVIPRYWGERSCLKLIYGVLIRVSAKWRRVKMSEYDLTLLKHLRELYGSASREETFSRKVAS